MTKKILMLAVVAALVVTGTVAAQQARGEAALGVEWDAAAYEAMSDAEKATYRQGYKDQIEQRAQDRGWVTDERRDFEPAGRNVARVPNLAGTITYHSGALGTCCGNGVFVGNHFNSAVNTAGTAVAPVETSGSITQITFDMIAVSAPNVFVSFYHNRVGTTAPRITSFLTTGVTGMNTKTLAITYSGSTFIGGVWQFTPDSPAVATGTVGGQGFHGVSGDDGGTATAIVDLTALNAAFSATGNVLTPVELMSFEVDAD